MNDINEALTKYIKELKLKVKNDIKRTIRTDNSVYQFGDGCMRDDRDHLFMALLLIPTLKEIRKSKKNNNYKIKELKNAFSHMKGYVYLCYFDVPDYIKALCEDLFKDN